MNHSRHFRLAALFLALSLMLGACGSAKPVSTEAETTPPATTEAPTTAVPTTAEPTTEEPTTEEPTTEEPTTEEPREPLTIEEYTLIDKDNVKVVIRDFAEDEEGAQINLSLANGTEKYYNQFGKPLTEKQRRGKGLGNPNTGGGQSM